MSLSACAILEDWQAKPPPPPEPAPAPVVAAPPPPPAAPPHLIAKGWGRIVNLTTSLDTMQRRRNSPYGVSKAALEAATMIWAQDLAGTGVTVNSLIPGGACDSDPERPPGRGQSQLLPVDVMNPLAVWLASDLSDGKSGGRYVGKLWDSSLAPSAAAAGCLEAPVLRAATAG